MSNDHSYANSYNHYAYISNFRSATLRLQNRDYSGPGVYHIITCAKGIEGRGPLFQHPFLRQLLQTNWMDLPERFRCTKLDEFTIMPDHVHFLIWPNKWPELAPEPAPHLWQIMQAYKSKIAVKWIEYIKRKYPDRSAKIWQAGYYERVIRVGELERVRYYIRKNPENFYEQLGWKRPFKLLFHDAE